MSAIDRLILSGGPGERRLALLKGDKILGFVIDRLAANEGDIILGRVLPRPDGLNAAFIEIGADCPGFLSRPGQTKEGDSLLVQVASPARRDKGANLSARPTLTGSHLVYGPFLRGVGLSRQISDQDSAARLTELLTPLVGAEEGVVARSQAPQADNETLTAELQRLRNDWRELEGRARTAKAPAALFAPGALARLLQQEPMIARLEVDDPALLPEARRHFAKAESRPGAWRDSGAADMLDLALAREVPLKGGGKLIIDETAGATVIDVDGGGMAAEAANHLALSEIARQLRLRAIAGHILIDVIPPAHKGAMEALLQRLRDELADDPTPSQIIGATRLGMVEMTRERRQPSLAEMFLTPSEPRRNHSSLALEALAALLTEAKHRPTAKFSLVAEPDIIRYLDRRPELVAETTTRLGRPFAMLAQTGQSGFEIKEAP